MLSLTQDMQCVSFKHLLSWKNCLNISRRVTVLNVRNDAATDLLLPFCDRGGSAIKLILRGDIGRVRKNSVEEKGKQNSYLVI